MDGSIYIELTYIWLMTDYSMHLNRWGVGQIVAKQYLGMP